MRKSICFLFLYFLMFVKAWESSKFHMFYLHIEDIMFYEDGNHSLLVALRTMADG